MGRFASNFWSSLGLKGVLVPRIHRGHAWVAASVARRFAFLGGLEQIGGSFVFEKGPLMS